MRELESLSYAPPKNAFSFSQKGMKKMPGALFTQSKGCYNYSVGGRLQRDSETNIQEAKYTPLEAKCRRILKATLRMLITILEAVCREVLKATLQGR